MSSLEFQCTHRYAGGFELNGAFQAERRITALFGPSGSGKTSILSMIAGFVRPQSGLIRLGDGKSILVDTARGISLAPEKRGVGFVFQDHLLFPHLTVEANLLYGTGRKNRRKTVELQRVVEVLELGGLLTRYPRGLSGGESQRVALGRALMSGPELLLMDEPLAALDEALKMRVLGYLERVVNEWNIPALFVSHAQSDVRRLAEWVIVLNQGRVVTQGPPDAALGKSEVLTWSNSGALVNLLRIEQAESENGQWLGRIGSQPLRLPPVDGVLATPVFVKFSPRDVIVCLHDVTGVSARNHLQGVIRELVVTPGGVFLAIDVGQILWAEVTPAAVTELALSPGTEVTCLLKTQSLQIVT